MMRRGSKQRGATMLEALIALVVLSTGTAAIAELLGYVSKSQGTARFQGASLDLYATISAEIQDAHCDVQPDGVTEMVDPGLAPTAGAWVDAPVAGSKIVTVGQMPQFSPPVAVRYQVSGRTRDVLQSDGTNQTLNNAPPHVDVVVEVRQVMNVPTMDDPAIVDGYWIRSFPIVKVCNLRTDDNGRGEFY
jgi:type II secretory pathway pseudopilin PulG